MLAFIQYLVERQAGTGCPEQDRSDDAHPKVEQGRKVLSRSSHGCWPLSRFGGKVIRDQLSLSRQTQCCAPKGGARTRSPVQVQPRMLACFGDGCCIKKRVFGPHRHAASRITGPGIPMSQAHHTNVVREALEPRKGWTYSPLGSQATTRLPGPLPAQVFRSLLFGRHGGC